MHRHQPATMSSSFHTHGLVGIDLHHAQSRRTGQQGTTSSSQPAPTGIRRALSTLCFTAGALLAGDKAFDTTECQPAS